MLTQRTAYRVSVLAQVGSRCRSSIRCAAWHQFSCRSAFARRARSPMSISAAAWRRRRALSSVARWRQAPTASLEIMAAIIASRLPFEAGVIPEAALHGAQCGFITRGRASIKHRWRGIILYLARPESLSAESNCVPRSSKPALSRQGIERQPPCALEIAVKASQINNRRNVMYRPAKS